MPASPAEPPSDSATPDAGVRPRWVRDIACFLAAQAFSLFGSSIVGYAVIWYLVGNASAAVYSLGMVAAMLPQGLIAIFGGVWADRHNRKWLVIGADGAIALATVGLAVLMFRGTAPLVAILAVLVLRSLGAGIQTPAVGGMVAQIVPLAHLMRVNSINATLQPIIFLVAPALAAVLFDAIDLKWIFLIDPAGAAIAIALTLTIPLNKVTRPDADAPPAYGRDLKEGLAFAWRRLDLRRIMWLLIVTFLLLVPAGNLLPVAIQQEFGGDTWKLAAVEIAWSGGMMAGGALLAVWGGLKRRMVMILVSTYAMGVATVALGLSYWLWLLVAVTALFGLVTPFFWTTAMTAVQETVEPHFQGRVLALANLVMALAAPLGLLVFGPLADRISIFALFLACGGLGLVATAGLSWRLPEMAPVLEQDGG
ncbi:MAG: MFS transporter [Propionibacteriaceae bacterium]|jgi:DHA3 family macrolide efflux protein-like MFS transporter|nr:MFS transporter [Propionibacteriaceae bacterium]